MKPYIGIVHKDEESAYGITFPDAPGCFSAADHIDDLFPMADEALGLWLRTMNDAHAEIPVLRDLSDLKRDPDWAKEFRDAALVIAVPSPLLRSRVAA